MTLSNSITIKRAKREVATTSSVFVDIFAGCGGLSLGLMQAGWTGLFAIEKDPFAFDTLSANLLKENSRYCFSWPDWLPQQPLCATEAATKYSDHLSKLAGKVDMLVGGPPCQGYSSAGRRDPEDPRNQLFASYLKMVNLLKPTVVLLENVRGITIDFEVADATDESVNYASKLVEALSQDYNVSSRMLDLSTFGVPQNRWRFFLVGIRKEHHTAAGLPKNPFDAIEANRLAFLQSKGIVAPLASKAAISDLEVTRNGTIPLKGTKRFQAIAYKTPITSYQELMRSQFDDPPSDTRLANHYAHIAKRFEDIIKTCHADNRLNVSLSREVREAHGLKKQATRVLDPSKPAPTVTSMPDDLLHYSEPRTLTVRENARLQSFPDWFVFCGKYTTGGHLRKIQVPRFTQVANAVPPLAAEAIGRSLLSYVGSSFNPSGSSGASAASNPTIIANSSNLSR